MPRSDWAPLVTQSFHLQFSMESIGSSRHKNNVDMSMFLRQLSLLIAAVLSLVCYSTPSLAQPCEGRSCRRVDPQLPLFEGRSQFCNAAVVSNHANHLNCVNSAYGYAAPTAGPETSTKLYLGIQPYVNAGGITTSSSFKGGLTQEYGYLLAAPDGHPDSRALYRVVNCGAHTGEVTTNPNHRNCRTEPIGYTSGLPVAARDPFAIQPTR